MPQPPKGAGAADRRDENFLFVGVMGVQNFLNQTYPGVGGGLCLGTFQKKMKKGCVGNKWGWRYAMLMLMGGVEEGSQGGPKTAT